MKRFLVTAGLSLFSLISVLAFSSSSTERVKSGMSTEQVSNLLGKPDVILVSEEDKDLVVWKYTINTIVSFVDGKVESVYQPRHSHN